MYKGSKAEYIRNILTHEGHKAFAKWKELRDTQPKLADAWGTVGSHFFDTGDLEASLNYFAVLQRGEIYRDVRQVWAYAVSVIKDCQTIHGMQQETLDAIAQVVYKEEQA